MAEAKKRVKIAGVSDGGSISLDFYVEPTVAVIPVEGGALLRIGGGALEIHMPVELLEKIRER